MLQVNHRRSRSTTVQFCLCKVGAMVWHVVWCVWCGVWCEVGSVMCGAWCVECGLWCTVLYCIQTLRNWFVQQDYWCFIAVPTNPLSRALPIQLAAKITAYLREYLYPVRAVWGPTRHPQITDVGKAQCRLTLA